MAIPAFREPAAGNVVCFDLETRPLAFWYGEATTAQITAFGWRVNGEGPVHTLTLVEGQRYVTDGGKRWTLKRAHKRFAQVLTEATLVYGHNIRRFDLGELNGWLLRLGLPSLPPLLTTDTLRDIPKRGRMSASLASLADMYGLDGEKLSMPTPAWERSNMLLPSAVRKTRKRVTVDVLLTERLRTRLLAEDVLREPKVWTP